MKASGITSETKIHSTMRSLSQGLLAFLLLFPLLSSSLPTSLHSKENRRRSLFDIISKIHPSTTISCAACKGVVAMMQSYAATGHGEEYFSEIIVYVCEKLKIQDTHVCTSVCKEFKDTIWNVFLVESVLTPDDICGWIFGDKCGVNPFQWFPSWNITIPEATAKHEDTGDFPIKDPSTVVKVLQITDTHLDNEYEQGSKTDCGEPLCCRRSDGKAGEHELAAPKWGYTGYCDSNVLMVHSMLEHMAETHQDVDYIIWTGDIPAHNIWQQSKNDQEISIHQAADLFEKYFPNKKVFPCVGNHEGVPVNSFPPQFVTGKMTGQWLRDVLADVWSRWLPEDTKDTIRRGGFYTTLITKGVRLISLNTNYGNSGNFWMFLHSQDPAGQLQWLSQVLEQAEIDEEKVHIIGHMPPNGVLKWWSFNFYRIVDRFHHIIKAQFFGHTHHDEFRIFYDMKTFSKPINIAYIAPSVTTYHDLNPGYRVYEIDGKLPNSTWSVVDHSTYILDLPKANRNDQPVWELEYRAQEMYAMKDLSPISWNELVNRMEKDDALFDKLYKAYYKQHINDTCVGPCKSNFLCVMKTALGGGFHNFCKFQTESHFGWFLKWLKETYNKC